MYIIIHHIMFVVSYFSNLCFCCTMKRRERTGYQLSRKSSQRVNHLCYARSCVHGHNDACACVVLCLLHSSCCM